MTFGGCLGDISVSSNLSEDPKRRLDEDEILSQMAYADVYFIFLLLRAYVQDHHACWPRFHRIVPELVILGSGEKPQRSTKNTGRSNFHSSKKPKPRGLEYLRSRCYGVYERCHKGKTDYFR